MSGTKGDPAKANIYDVYWRGPTALLVVGVAMFVAASASPVMAQCTISAGSDLFATPGPGGGPGPTYDDLSIPAGYFAPGSDPFDGRVYLKGNPFPVPGPWGFENADTIVERLTDASFMVPPFPAVDTVDTRMVALDLVSIKTLIADEIKRLEEG